MARRYCEHCEYEWESRVEKPKSCPRCKKRFDYYCLQKRVTMR